MKESCDILVIGCGPAGLSAAGYASRAGYDTLALDAAAPGGQLMFIDQIENYPGSESVSGAELAQKMEEQASGFNAQIEYSEVHEIRKEGETFIALTFDGEIKARAVILAMGARHRKLEVEGEDTYEGRGVSYCATCDGPFFRGKDVVVVGGGDTALTDAYYLSRLCSKVYLVHRRTQFRAQKALQDRVLEKDNIEIVTPHTLSRINGDGNAVTSVTLDDGSQIPCQGVFIFTGIVPNSDSVRSFVACDQNGFIITDDRMRTDVSGVFAAGDVRTTAFRQVVTACSDGAVAAHMADEYLSR